MSSKLTEHPDIGTWKLNWHMRCLAYKVKSLNRWADFYEILCGESLWRKKITIWSKFFIKMNRTPRYWHSKNGKIAQKSHIIQHSGQTVRLTTKSDKKPNDLHEIPYQKCGLRFRFRPTVHPQFTKIGGSEQGPKKIPKNFFFGLFSVFGNF